MNHLLESDLGPNPRYNWRWSEDLLHVMEIIDPDSGRVQFVEYTSPEGLTVMTPKTEVRKLLPEHYEQWIMCALSQVNDRDGSISEAGTAAWIPVTSAASGPVCLANGDVPNLATTGSVIQAIRQTRQQRFRDYEIGWEESQRKKEKTHWNNVYDQIRDAGTAYCNVPGRKGHVSFPLVTLS